MEESTELILSRLILPLVKDIVLPKINSTFQKYEPKNITSEDVETKFKDYLIQRYEKYLIVDTLVFPNKQTLLKILYEPLTVSCNNYENENLEIKIDSFKNEFLPNFVRVIIEDTAGMGKSTITKKLFLSIIEEKKGIPILIELSQLNNKNSILKEIQKQISPLGKKLSQEFILNLINEGDFVFLFDGFDEIALGNKDYVIKELKKFIEKANYNQFLITSRPEDSLTSFGDFQKFKVKPLNKGEAYSLLNKYDFYSHHPISKSLIKKLNDNPQDSLQEYLNNPFLVSLLYKSYDFKKDIPIKKSQFYQQVFDALFENHDLSKEGYLKREKHSNLHIDDFERVLRYLAYFTSIENKVEYDKNGIINYINKSKSHLNDLKFNSSDFLKDLIKTVPVFKKEGNYYKWAHKSLQDYFAAKFIWIDSKENQVKILEKIYNDSSNKRFYNLLDLFFELDAKTFEFTILYWLLKDFRNFSDSNYNFLNKNNAETKRRIENSFGKSCTIIVLDSVNYENIRTGKDRDIHGKYAKKVTQFFTGTNFNYFKKEKNVAFTYIYFDSSKKTILELISKRSPELAERRDHKVDLELPVTLEIDTPYILNDDPKNVLNDLSNLELVNDLIMSDYAFKFDKAFKKLKEIEKVLKSNINNDILDW